MNSLKKVSYIADLAGSHLDGSDGPIPARFLADSRLISPGDAFVAFRGQQFDGHDFIPDAIERGASLVICEKPILTPDGVASILVEDTFSTIPKMASQHLNLNRSSLEIIAITGSVGKTTTREMLKTALKPSFTVHSAEHSYNTLIGCALSILAMPEETSILILEMGTNHPGEISEMVHFFPPTIALITEVKEAHLEGLGSLEGVLEAKFEIIQSPFLKAFFYLGDNQLIATKALSLQPNITKFSVGFGENDFKVCSVNFTLEQALPCLTFDLIHKKNVYSASSHLFGRHSALAAAFAISIATYLDASIDKALDDIKHIQPPSGRGQFFKLPRGAVLIDDSYNANPSSMKASINETIQIPAKRHIAVIGEMLELGTETTYNHHALTPFFYNFSKVFLMGKIWEEVFRNTHIPENISFFDNHDILAEKLKSELRNGDIILIKGSHGNRLDKTVKLLLQEV